MSLIANTVEIKEIIANSVDIRTVVANGEVVWRKMRDWAFTATTSTSLQDIAEYRIDHSGVREPYVDDNRLFGTSINSIEDGEDIAIVIVSYGSCCSTGIH